MDNVVEDDWPVNFTKVALLRILANGNCLLDSAFVYFVGDLSVALELGARKL